jgi:hypothetical protein
LIFSFESISVADPDPGSGAFLTPGSGMGKKSGSGIQIRYEQPGSYFRELRNSFLVKYLNYFMWVRDPGWKKFGSGIRNGKSSDPGSVINIPDPQRWEVFFP